MSRCDHDNDGPWGPTATAKQGPSSLFAHMIK